MKIAMWSGPRNLSTAMMYAFAARGDCAVVDEPFYAAFLARTGLEHPMRAEVLAAQPSDPDQVARALTGPVPEGKTYYYQKHMTHHMLPDFPRGWLSACTNAFLIRHPARVVASYVRKREAPVLDDLGFAQQAEIFDQVAQITGAAPAVIDSADIRSDPAAALAGLCAALGIPWTDKMLHWPPGGHPSDGAWAPHWYAAVHRSTGFDEPEPALPDLPPAYARLAEAALPHYARLLRHAIRVPAA